MRRTQRLGKSARGSGACGSKMSGTMKTDALWPTKSKIGADG